MTNVLIYIVDALRADHLQCYGYHRPTSPNLDAMAAENSGLCFTQAFAPSTWTKPIGASILSGCFPPAHGVRTRSDLFTRKVPRLPALLQSAGYRTAAVSTIGNVSSPLGFGVGFEHFVDLYKDQDLSAHRVVSNTGAWKLYFEEDTTVVLPLAEDVNARALPWLRQASRRETPWFLFLWVLDPHDPYYPPAGFDRWRDPAYRGRIDGSAASVRQVRSPGDLQRLLDLYDGEIAYMDDQFGRLVAELKDLDVYDDTLIVVAGDHGEAFGEHGDFVHGHLAYEEVLRVPLLLKLPASVPVSRQHSDALVQLTDIAPTVLEVLGLGHLSAGMQGYSLLPHLQGGPSPGSVVYAETQASEANQRLLAVRSHQWKYMRVDPAGDYRPEQGPSAAGAEAPRESTRHGGVWRRRLAGYGRQLASWEMIKKVARNPMFYLRRQLSDREMLFDLMADPGETHNVIAQHPDVVAEMRAALDAWLAECLVYGRLGDEGGDDLGMDDDTLRQLQGLGYL